MAHLSSVRAARTLAAASLSRCRHSRRQRLFQYNAALFSTVLTRVVNRWYTRVTDFSARSESAGICSRGKGVVTWLTGLARTDQLAARMHLTQSHVRTIPAGFQMP